MAAYEELYEGATCQVKVDDGMLSEPIDNIHLRTGPKVYIIYAGPYPIQRGVKQRSVLSPALFLLVIDPLLKGGLPTLSNPISSNKM